MNKLAGLIPKDPNLIYKILVTVCVALIVLVAVIIVSKMIKSASKKMSDEEITSMFTPDDVNTQQTSTGLIEKWNRFWGKRLVDSHVKLAGVTKNNAGIYALAMLAGVFIIMLFLSKLNFFIAFLVSGGVTLGASVFLSFKADQHTRKISNEIPGFLSAVLSSLQTTRSYTIVLRSAIQAAGAELQDELSDITRLLDANQPLDQALEGYIERSSFEELRFLMVCIQRASAAGQPIEKEVKKIQAQVANKQQLRRKRETAVAGTMPSIYVVSAAIPLMFVYTWFSMPMARQYWFHSLIANIVLLAIIAIWAIGMLIIKHVVDGIKAL